jgi:hypothetical protein
VELTKSLFESLLLLQAIAAAANIAANISSQRNLMFSQLIRLCLTEMPVKSSSLANQSDSRGGIGLAPE